MDEAAARSWFDADFGLAFLRGTGGFDRHGQEASACCTRGMSLWPITSTLPFSGICAKLGEVRLGSVCRLSDLENRGRPLRLEARALSAMPRSAVHLLGREKLAHIGPAFDALRGANLHQPMPVFDDREFVAVFDRRGDGRFQREFLPQIERAGADVGFTERMNRRRLIDARNEKGDERENKVQRESMSRASAASVSVMAEETDAPARSNFIARDVTRP